MTASILTLDLTERRFTQAIVVFVAMGFLGLLAAGAAAGWVMALNQERTGWVTRTYEVERHINVLRTQLERMGSVRRGYLIDQDPAFQVGFADAVKAIEPQLTTLAQLTADNPRQQARISACEGLIDKLESTLAVSMRDAESGRAAEAVKTFRADGSLALTAQIRQVTTDMMAEENRLLAIRVGQQQSAVGIFFAVLISSGALLVAVAGASIWVILRYTRELGRSRDSLKNLNDNLEQAVEMRTMDLRRANDEIQRFAYIVSHDLRSPLVNVLGFTGELDAAMKPMAGLIERAEARCPQILDEDVRRAVREDVPEAIGFIRTSTQKMDRLINAILKLSREGRKTITPERLDVDALVQEIADSLRHRVVELGAEIAIEKPLPAIVTDRLALEQILSNLVENAVKYLSPKRPGRIVISGRRTHDRIIYSVSDNGRGIDPKDHERVFDLFRRSGVQDQPGEGIGLAHVRALAYRLGGIVGCQSELDQGAVFSLSLPPVYSGDTSR